MTTYAGLLIGGSAVFLLTRAAVLRLRTGHRRVSLHPVEVAYLVDGAEHALLVAGVALHDAGVLRPTSRQEAVRITREQVLQRAPSGCVVDQAAAPEHPLERAVVRSLATGPDRPVTEKSLQTAPEMAELRAHLTRLGLIVDGRMAWLVRLSALWPLVVVGIGLIWLDPGAGAWAWLAVAAAVAITTAGIVFGVPRRRPAAQRAIRVAAAHRRDLAARLTDRLDDVGYGTDNPELREAGLDPLVVAAHGSIVLLSADPLLAVALGVLPPRPERRGPFHWPPLHSQAGWHGWGVDG